MNNKVLVAACVAASVVVVACGSSTHSARSASTAGGYALRVVQQPSGGKPVRFTISHRGAAVTDFDTEQTVRMQLYLIRDDLSGYQHVHPAMDSKGDWSASFGTLAAGTYRLYAQFAPRASSSAGPLVLSPAVKIGGATSPTMTMPPGSVALIDGYKVALTQQLKHGSATMLAIMITKDGKPSTDLQPYLDTYAHVTAIREQDLAFAQLHPEGAVHGDHGGPTLTFHAELAEAGTYRLFVQFQTIGQLHTVVLGLTVR